MSDIDERTLTMKCEKCQHEMKVHRDTLLPDNCPECGKPVNYAKVNTALVLIIGDLLMDILDKANEIKEVKE